MKPCAVCGKDFEPAFSSMQSVCGIKCARRVPIVARKKAAAERKETKVRRDNVKTRREHLQDTQRAFNAYICRRDSHLPCVSCGCLKSPGWHASHYRSVGSSPALRFDPANVHRSCVKCNLHLHGNPIPYRLELARRIGSAELERLEGPQPVKKWIVDELKEIAKDCRAKVRQMHNY
jgi:hypothetical protein